MNAVIKAAVALTVLVAVVSIVIAVAGLHESSPVVAGLIALVLFILFTVGAIYWGLSQTAADNGYGKQLLNGLLIGVVAGVLIFGFSMLMTGVLFPDYLEQSKEAVAAFLDAQNMPEAQLEAQLEANEARTSVGEAMKGTIGTIVTSLIVAAIVAIFKRRK